MLYDGNDVEFPNRILQLCLNCCHLTTPRSWVSLYCVLSKGELGFYKDSKGPSSGGTHGGEPLLSLHKATSEVASDYKKKKHVFKLQ